jgi:hypothetical protein
VNTIRLAGLGCLIGGLLFFSLNLVPGLGPDGPLALLSNLLSVLLLLGLLGGPVGLIAMGAIGEGRTKLAGRIGAGVALLGLLSYLGGVVYTTLVDPSMGLFYALGALLSGVGMLIMGVAVILARRLGGWRRLTPALVGLYYLLMIPIQVVFFIGPTGQPSELLLGFWGLAWALLGAAIASYEASPALARSH